jgi:hypothetical protein
VHWEGRTGELAALRDGRYSLVLHALADDAASGVGATHGARLGEETQRWDIAVGRIAAPRMPAFTALPTGADARMAAGGTRPQAVPAPGSLPYTIYLANLHSQTNDSDGGGVLTSCTGSQNPQAGAYGPSTAYAYAKTAGLDVLMASEHNHLFDGSTGTNASGSASGATSRYHAGLATAASFTAANPGFVAIYGMEWGVISNGGHLNILNSTQLFSWEYNSSNQLFGDAFTAKSDYPGIYATMRAGGLLGQFNHPSTTTQFKVGSTDLGYSADGDEVMALAEVLNSSAFSTNTTETETSLDNYEAAFNLLLGRGFHVAPTSDQDNHCANWGRSYTNRTGLLIPNGTAPSLASVLEAVRARRVFATMDKTAQLVLTANGHVMGERFANTGTLTLAANYASSSGHTVSSVQILQGVPGANGAVGTLSTAGSVTTTPATGAHFYYAKVTQDDGRILWSAPVWVTQGSGGGGGGDTTPPTATASEAGTAGTITLSATASDNVGVARVDFLVDNAVKGSDATSPYALSLDSTLLANGSHTLVARAYDAAGNAGSSSAVTFSVNNAGGTMTETESNGTLATANVVGTHTTITGTMGNTTDKDYFKVTLAAGQTIKVGMTGPAGLDYDLYLVDASGTDLAWSEGNTSTESLTWKNGTSAVTVYIEVVSYSGSSTTQPYTLTVSYP